MPAGELVDARTVEAGRLVGGRQIEGPQAIEEVDGKLSHLLACPGQDRQAFQTLRLEEIALFSPGVQSSAGPGQAIQREIRIVGPVRTADEAGGSGSLCDDFVRRSA